MNSKRCHLPKLDVLCAMVILTHADYEDDDDNYNNTDDDGGGSGCTGGREYDDDDDYNDGNYVPLSYTVGVLKNTLLINF